MAQGDESCTVCRAVARDGDLNRRSKASEHAEYIHMVTDNGTPQLNRRRELTENVGARSVVLIRRTNINEVGGGNTTLVQLQADALMASSNVGE